MSNIFRTIAIPADIADTARKIANALGSSTSGMFVSEFREIPSTPGEEGSGSELVGVMSSGIIDSESAILKDEISLYNAIQSYNPSAGVTLQECIDFVTARDQTELDPLPRQDELITEVKAAEVAEPWVQPAGAHDAYNTNDTVSYQGYSYISLMDANVWAPDVTGWRILWGQLAGYMPWQQPLGAHDAYKLEAKVNHNGKNWNNTGSDANVWEPGVFGWTEIV